MSYRTIKNPYPFPQEEESITLQEQMEADRHHHSEKSYLLVDTPMCCEECRFYDADWCTAFGGVVRDLVDVPTDYKKADWCPLREVPEEEWENVLDHDDHIYAMGFNDCLHIITGEGWVCKLGNK